MKKQNKTQDNSTLKNTKLLSTNRRVTTNTPAFLDCMPIPTGVSVKSEIFKVLWKMKKRGLLESLHPPTDTA